MVGIRGDLGNLQSSIDFYLSITSKDAVLDSKTLRDRFFSMFQDEDSYREENFLVYQERISDNYMVNHDVEPTLMEDEELFDEDTSYFDEVEEDNFVEEVAEVVEEPEEAVEGDFVEEIDEDDFVKEDFIEETTEDEEDGYTSWGEEDEDFVNWGNTEEDEDIDEINSKEEEVVEDEEDDFSNWNNEEDLGEEYSEEGDDFSIWGNEEDEDLSEESQEEEDEEVGEDDFSNWGNTDEVEDEVSEEFKDAFDDLDLGMFDGSFDEVEEVVKPENKVDTVVKKKGIEISEVPKDLREFIKMYPNCEITVALKYFSKKEIDKQLSLGRVFKRKNKLMI